MKKYKKLIIGSLMTAMIMTSPIASFAESNKNEDNGRDNKIKTEQFRKEKGEDNKKSNSWFGSNWFNRGNEKIIVAPIVSDLVAVSTKSNKAKVNWSTNSRSNTFIWYSTTSPVDTSIAPNMKRNDRTLKHKFELRKLQPNTKYYLVVGGANIAGTTKSSEISFTTGEILAETTPVIDTVAPVISEREIKVNDSNVTISWKTNEPSTSKLFYAINSAPINVNEGGTTSITDEKLVTKHSLSIPNLTSNTLYHFILKSVDAKNNTTISSESSFITN